MKRMAAAAVVLILGGSPPSRAEVQELRFGAFLVEKSFTLAATPERVWQALTGDVSPWWDHTFSESPVRLYIEAKPGGGFWEIFDETGDGVRHAEVIWAERNRMLKMRGPLGFSGKSLDMVHTFTLEDLDGGTRLKLQVRASGEMEEGWPDAVDGVWEHFLGERLRGWLAGDLTTE